MDAKLKELQEKKNAAATAIKELGDRQANWTAEDRGQWDVVNTEYDAAAAALTARNDELKNSEAVQKRLKEIEDANKATNGDKGGGFDGDKRRELDPERQASIDHRAIALQAWMLTRRGLEITEEHRASCKAIGVNPAQAEFNPSWNPTYGKPVFSCRGQMPTREFRVGLDITTSGAGKETIPQGFMAELEAVTLEYAHVRQVCRVVSTPGGNAMPWPKVDDTGNSGVMLAEATTIGTSVDATYSAVTFSSYKMSSRACFVSSEIIQDSAFNLASVIAGQLGERLGRIEGSYATTGTGTSEPKGIVTCAGTGKTSAAAAAFTPDEIIDLVHSLDPSNRSGSSVGFMFHDTALAYIRKFKTADGQYLWQPGMSAGQLDTVYGYPYTINQAMEPLVSNVPVTAKKHVLFGDFSKFIIRDAGSVRFYHLTERYRDTDQDAFVAFKRFDSNTIKASALKVLLQA